MFQFIVKLFVKMTVCGVSEYMQPFSQPHADMLRGSLPPNQMTDDEKSHFPQFARLLKLLTF
jgi:hypothetical protein